MMKVHCLLPPVLAGDCSVPEDALNVSSHTGVFKTPYKTNRRGFLRIRIRTRLNIKEQRNGESVEGMENIMQASLKKWGEGGGGRRVNDGTKVRKEQR